VFFSASYRRQLEEDELEIVQRNSFPAQQLRGDLGESRIDKRTVGQKYRQTQQCKTQDDRRPPQQAEWDQARRAVLRADHGIAPPSENGTLGSQQDYREDQ
jgi:hypothetical protein